MRRGIVTAAIVLVAAGVFFLKPNRPAETPVETETSPSSSTFTSAPNTPPPESVPPAVVSAPSGESWRPEIQNEFQAAGRIDNDPEASERRLDLLASHLTPAEITKLKNLVLNADAQGDPRAVGAELLARARSPEALAALTEIAVSPVPKLNEQRREEFERALRGRAIEGLGDHPSAQAENALERTIRESADTFLTDRAQRARAARRGAVPRPEAQDRDALRRLTR